MAECACGGNGTKRLLSMTDFGVEKGKTVITDELVNDLTMKVAETLVDG